MAARPEPIDRRALNRALLARQLLLERRKGTAASTIEHLVGMQAQVPAHPYVGVWSRLAGFRPAELSRMVEARTAVRISLLRNTIHLVTARDAFALKPLYAAHGTRHFLHGSPWGKNLKESELGPVLEAGREILGQKPHTVAQLAKLLGERFPGNDPQSMAYAVRAILPLVFTPPRGIWGLSGPVALTTFEAWLGRPPGPPIAAERLVTRYLAAYGPASVADMRAWSGLAMRPTFEKLRGKLRVFREADGPELFDLPGAPRPDGATPAPVRMLPDYDNILLAHADRTRILPEGKHLGMFNAAGIMKGSVLVDGTVRAMWQPEVDGGKTALVITSFAKRLTQSERTAIADESALLLEFLAPGAGHDVRFGPVRD